MNMNRLIRKLYYSCWVYDARRKYKNMIPYLSGEKRVLEIGSGPGSLWQVLAEKNFIVKGYDIEAKHYYEQYRPVIFDGNKLPLRDREFDVAILSTVLHHCHDPEALIMEACRVSSRVIIIEDLPFGRWHLSVLKAADALVNMQFTGHPFNFRSHLQWRRTFRRLGIKCLNFHVFPVAKIFRQVVYYLKPFVRSKVKASAKGVICHDKVSTY